MYERSPIAHVKKVKTPVMLNIGKVDLRVPPSQGYEYYHALRAQGKYVEARNVLIGSESQSVICIGRPLFAFRLT